MKIGRGGSGRRERGRKREKGREEERCGKRRGALLQESMVRFL